MVRCSFYWDGEKIRTASRGGKNYDYAMMDFLNHPKFIEFFQNHPTVVLDGEIYKHGLSLQQISGKARLEKDTSGCDILQYYIYDIMIPDVPFKDRLLLLSEIKNDLNLGFDPDKEFEDDELRIQIVPHTLIKGDNILDQIWKLHDQYVAEGWEGCVARDASKNYKFGGRGMEMIKFKNYQDDEFEITGIAEGLRDEDMCFTCVTSTGIGFKAKPMGSREVKEEYRKNIDKIIGKKATVKFFYLSDDGTPLQPVLKAIRDYE